MKIFVGKAARVFTAFLIFGNLLQVTAQADSIYRVPAGTRIRLKMDGGINSSFSSVDDTFKATIAKAVVIHDSVVLPAGIMIEGRVLSVTKPISGHDGALEVAFETLFIKKETQRTIDGELVDKIRPDSSMASNLLAVFGGAGIGALVGGLAKGGSGAGIGASVGAGAGLAVALLKRGRNVGIRGNQEFEIELKKDVMLPVMDY